MKLLKPYLLKQVIKAVVITPILFWQLPVSLMGVLLYIVLNQLLRFAWWFILSLGLIINLFTLAIIKATNPTLNLMVYLEHGVFVNQQFCYALFTHTIAFWLYYFYSHMLTYLLGFSLLLAGLLATIDYIFKCWAFKKLQRMVINNHPMFSSLNNQKEEGTLLGISKNTQQMVIIPDRAINQVLLVLGTTGSGKTITLQRFYQRAVNKHYPLLIIDGKPTSENIKQIFTLAKKSNQPFYGFNCGNFYHYDCLAHGGYTELKDKIISLKDEWSSDYYRSIAEDYLQTTFEVLLKSKEAFDLKTVVDCIEYETLALKVRVLSDKALMDRVRRLENYNRKDITGLQAHLNILIQSELGQFFEKSNQTFNLTQVIENKGIAYFALPALRFPGFSKVLGKLIINDIKAVIDRSSLAPLFTIFDEFSVFAGEQVLNLENMGRGKGLHAIFGTQGLADLQRVDKSFANQILNCVNTIICHRLNDHESAKEISDWIGTRDSLDITSHINSQPGSFSSSSIKRNRELIIHPDAIKQGLQPGEAYYVTKVGKFKQDKIKIYYDR